MHNKKLQERIRNTEDQLRKAFSKSLKTMIRKNQERGDAWRNSGLKGQFIEIHSMYYRLRNLIWEQEKLPSPDDKEYKIWYDAVMNALEDLRNFTILAEMCMMEQNYDGSKFEMPL